MSSHNLLFEVDGWTTPNVENESIFSFIFDMFSSMQETIWFDSVYNFAEILHFFPKFYLFGMWYSYRWRF